MTTLTHLLKFPTLFLATWLFTLSLLTPTHAADLTFTPATPVVEVGQEITLTVSGTSGQITWSAQKGWIVGVGNQATYKAPDQAMIDAVMVLDAAGNIGTVKIQVVAKSNISQENAVWEVFTNRSHIRALLLSGDGKNLWVGTGGGLEKRDAQTGEIQQIFLNADGLPDNRVTALLSDSQGGLWVGTYEGGLAYYTAQGQWQVFNTQNSGLPDNRVTALLSDSQGGLWAGTHEGGLTHYTAQGEWQVFNTQNSGLPDKFVIALLSDGQGGLWVGTYEGGLAHYTAPGEWQVFNTQNSGLPNNWVDALLSDSQGGLWVGTHGGLAHYTAQWQVFNPENSSLPDNKVRALLSDSQGGLWAGTYEGGLAHYTAPGEWQVFNPENSSLPDNRVNALLSDSQGGLWVGTWLGGLAHYTAPGEWQVFNPEKSGLLASNVGALLSDSQDGLWVGTWSNGLVHYTAQGEWLVFHSQNSGLPDNSIDALLSDSQGDLWVGTDGGGLAHYIAPGEWQVFDHENSGLPDNHVNALLSDSQGDLWVGTDGGGLAHYIAPGEWQVFDHENSGLPDNYVNALLSDGQGGLWVGTGRGGLAHYTAPGEWQVFNPENSRLPDNRVDALLSDGQGGLWVGTGGSGGLAHYTAQGEWQVFNTQNSGLPDNLVTALLTDSQGGLWVGTDSGGLAHYTAQGEWQVFNTQNSGLPHNWVTALLTDSQGGLWVGTGSGLAHLTFPEKQTGNRAAILIASGGNDTTNSLWETTESITTYLYKMLAARKFVNEEIYYLSSKDWADFNGDGYNDLIVDAPRPERPLVLDDLRQAFTWAKERGKLDQPLYVFFMDHGGTEKLQLSKLEYMEATDLKAILDDYQSTTGNQLVLVIEACYSGSLLPVLKAPNRAILTSASANETANFVDKQGFTRFFTKYLLSGANFFESYQLAQRDQNKMLGKLAERTVVAGAEETAKTTQSPQIDDNGDGVYDLTQDGQWLKQLKINGDLQMADSTLTVESLTSSTTLPVGQSLNLQAKAGTVSGQVKQVWAVIRPPRMNRVIDTNGTPILAFPRENLYPTQEKDTWQATWNWNNAVYNGEYEITFYAEDKQGNITGNETSVIITVTGGVEPPPQATVTFQVEKDRYQRGEPFKATLTEELGWGYDLYAAVLFPDGKNFMTLKNTNELRPMNEAKPWYAPRQPHQAVTLFDLTLPADIPTGQYCLFGILSPEQNDVFETLGKGLWVMEKKCFEIQ